MTDKLKIDAHLIAAAPDMYEALLASSELHNKLNDIILRYLTDRIGKTQMIDEVIPLSDGPDRRRVAKLMNDALASARGEVT